MAAIITNKFRVHNAEQFKEGFSEAAATNMYLFIGRPQAWADDTSPDTPVDTVADEYYYWDDMVALKRIQSSDVSHAIVRRNWTSGKYYDIYRHDYNGTTAGVNIDTGAGTTPASLFDANFFVVTDDYNVYKCINNRNPSTNAVVASTDKPTGTQTSIITTSDGYQWKYMYSISPADVLKFVSTDFIPVKTVGSNPGTSDPYYNQYLVEDAAADGSISYIQITDGGSGYGSTPTVTVTGDGTGATATAVVNAGVVTGVNITTPGTGYTFATVIISGGSPSSAATASAIISPKGGHGKNAVEELGGFYVAMNVRLEYDDGSGDFPVDNDYRRIGIVRDPTTFGTTTVATSSTLKATYEIELASGVTGTFEVDEIITGGTSGATGRVVSYDSTTRTVRYIKTRTTENTTPFQTAETITGGTSSASGTSASLANPEVQADSGDVIYVENRRPINRASDQVEDIKIVCEF